MSLGGRLAILFQARKVRHGNDASTRSAGGSRRPSDNPTPSQIITQAMHLQFTFIEFHSPDNLPGRKEDVGQPPG